MRDEPRHSSTNESGPDWTKEPEGSPYLVKGRRGLRLGLTWNVPWTHLEECGEGKHNEVTVRTFNNEVGQAGLSNVRLHVEDRYGELLAPAI